MLDKIKGFHLELTNICMLKCPRCARTKFIEQFGMKTWTNKNIAFSELQHFLDIDLSNLNITLCGVFGDPIYHPEFLQIVGWFKSKNANVHINTNGSYKSADWWKELFSTLGPLDSIFFGIDGVPSNFTKYRVNADWNSIEYGLQAASTAIAHTVWQFIPFSYNIGDIDEARALSNKYNIKEFLLCKSDRWDNEADPFKPPDSSLINTRYSSIIEWRSSVKKINQINPKCINTNYNHYVSADGFYIPCCYAADYRFYYKSEFYKNKEKYNIANTTISKLLNNETFFNRLANKEISPDYCTFNCAKYD